MLPVALAALLSCATGTATPETLATVPFRIERAVACRGVREGLPFESGRTFQLGHGRVCVWFGGREGTHPTTVRAEIWREAPVECVARCALVIPPRSPGGLLNVGLHSGAPLPAGAYRVLLTAPDTRTTLRFRVVDGPADVAVPDAPVARVRTDPAHGFRVTVPRGWEDAAVEPGALAFVRAGEPQAVALMVVRHETDATTAAEVAAQLAAALLGDVDYLVINRRAGILGTRHTAVLLIDRADGERLKVVVIPREDGATARTFFGALLTCNGLDFEAVEPEFDGIVSSFQVLPLNPP